MTELKENKSLKILSNILFAIFMLVMAFLILITAQSRLTGMEPSLFGNRLYVVDSGSMEPALKANSLIVVNESTPDQIEMGDILTYYGAESRTRVTHRVVEIGPNNEYFITQGDANNTEDAMPVERENVIGIVVISIPYIGYAFRFLSSTQGIIFIISVGIIALITPLIFKRKPKEA
ncbi:signal peptidase I [Gudongella sp. DL1XJH-153]|uniref:signal peptidase I n=1 Tax=Gudongella sp. DL1XJH-153 TaxID=3409804 RepID=UPI003BB584AF